MSELDRDSIIKALECCCGDIVECQKCAYVKNGYSRCKERAAQDALSLITSQEQRIRELTEDLHASCTELTQKCASLTEENERLRAELDSRPPKLVITRSISLDLIVLNIRKNITPSGTRGEKLRDFAYCAAQDFRTRTATVIPSARSVAPSNALQARNSMRHITRRSRVLTRTAITNTIPTRLTSASAVPRKRAWARVNITPNKKRNYWRKEKMQNLNERVEKMLSADYKDRFQAEYRQTKIRYDKLHAMIVKADAGKLEFEPTCPIELLRRQASAMGQYLYCMEVRAQIEGIDLI